MQESKSRGGPYLAALWQLVNRQVTFIKRKESLKTLLMGLSVFVVFLLFMGLVQFSTPDLPGNDAYYHIKIAYLMRTQGLKPDFPWLPLTILNPREFYDHHFLFHVLLIPFTSGDLVVGAKWAAVVFSGLAFLVIWRLLDAQRVPYAALWALGLLAVSEAFVSRMSMTRGQSLSLALMALALHWLLTGRHRGLIVLGFVYVWSYNAFPLLLGVAGAYVAALWLVEKRFDFRPLLYSGLGIAAGSVLNPYFPYNLLFVYQHIVPKLVDATAVSVGREWYPYTTGQLLTNSPLALLLFVSAALPLGLSGRRMDVRVATGFLLATLFGLMLFQSRRFIEYFPPFSLVFAALAWAPVLSEMKGRAGEERQGVQRIWWRRIRRHAPALVMVAILLPCGWITFQGSRESLQGSKPRELYAGASAWLAANTPAGERVFQTDWDDFTRLFFYNTHNTYLVGLDPTYMQRYDADLYDVWVDVTRGRVEDPSQIIKDHFGARYVISDLLHDDFLRRAEQDPQMAEVYRDEDAVIYQIVNG
jgi:hypothetical protein